MTAAGAVPATGYTKPIYHQQAPDTAGFPFIILNRQSGTRVGETFGDPEVVEEDIWLIKAVDRSTSADTAEKIADRVQTVIVDANLSGNLGSINVWYLRRESDVQYSEVTAGVVYQHCGGLYRLSYA